MGNYAPDWAIAFKKGAAKHIFFIAETKGSLESMELRGVEKAKIACGKYSLMMLQQVMFALVLYQTTMNC